MDFYELGDLFVDRQKKQEKLLAQKNDYAAELVLYDGEQKLSDIYKITLHPVNESGSFNVSKMGQIFYLFSGYCELNVDGRSIMMLPGNLFYLSSEKVYKISQLAPGTMLVKLELKSEEQLHVSFSKIELKNSEEEEMKAYQQIRNVGYILFSSNKTDDPSYLIERLIAEQITDLEHSGLVVDSISQICIVELLRGGYFVPIEQCIGKTKFSKDDFLDYIDVHFQKTDLNKMAVFFGYNPNYLSNTLKKMTGKSFMELVQIKKLNVAASLLSNPQITIEEIVNYLGYSSSSFFYRKFKEFYHTSPGQMRKNLWKEEL